MCGLYIKISGNYFEDKFLTSHVIEKKLHFYFDLEMYELWTTQVFYKKYKQAENNMYLT